jgi:hypothetical protein
MFEGTESAFNTELVPSNISLQFWIYRCKILTVITETLIVVRESKETKLHLASNSIYLLELVEYKTTTYND